MQLSSLRISTLQASPMYCIPTLEINSKDLKIVLLKRLWLPQEYQKDSLLFLENISARRPQAKMHSFKDAIKNYAKNHRRRDPRTDTWRRNAGKGQARELSRSYTPPGEIRRESPFSPGTGAQRCGSSISTYRDELGYLSRNIRCDGQIRIFESSFAVRSITIGTDGGKARSHLADLVAPDLSKLFQTGSGGAIAQILTKPSPSFSWKSRQAM